MSNEIIDVHIHFGSPKDEESGCYWSEEFTKTAAYYAMLLITRSLFKKVDINRVKKHMLGVIKDSKFVNKSVLLAMDQVYDEAGVVRPEKTHLYVPSRFIADLAKNNDRLLFGASVHPYRSDWTDELDSCLENKAVLCKWLPSSQMIDPSHPKCIPFYRKLAEHQFPLLCHAGPEYTIPTSDKKYNEFNNPKYLRAALDHGVPVIIAHCCLPYFWILDLNYQDDFDEFLKLVEEADKNNWNLYADLSALCTPLREPYFDIIKNRVPPQRLLFGSDYPVPLFEISHNKNKDFFSWLKFVLKMIVTENPLDRNYLILKENGFDESVFTNASELFARIRY